MAIVKTAGAKIVRRIFEERERAEAARPLSHRLRPHIGASLIGHECARHVWYAWRWAREIDHPGRLLTLFDTGLAYEDRFADELRSIGMDVRQRSNAGLEYKVAGLGGHFGGSLDGVARGVPGAEKSWHTLEFKTHSAKSFKRLTSQRVRASKPRHFAQMQCYMRGLGLKRSLYVAGCKDNDDRHVERIEFDPVGYAILFEKAKSIVCADEAPPRCDGAGPDNFACMYCDYADICLGAGPGRWSIPRKSCRTCRYAHPFVVEDDLAPRQPDARGARWVCAHEAPPIDVLGDEHKDLPLDRQHRGCDAWLPRADMLGPDRLRDASLDAEAIGEPDILGCGSFAYIAETEPGRAELVIADDTLTRVQITRHIGRRITAIAEPPPEGWADDLIVWRNSEIERASHIEEEAPGRPILILADGTRLETEGAS